MIPELMDIIQAQLSSHENHRQDYVSALAYGLSTAIEKWVDARCGDKPAVLSLPSEGEIHGAIADVMGCQALSDLGQQWPRAVKALHDFIAARVVVAPPADPPTRWRLAEIVADARGPEASTTEDELRIADRVLAAFPGKLQLRRWPTKEEISDVLRRARERRGHSWDHQSKPSPWEFEQADAVIALLFALAEPVEIDENLLGSLIDQELRAQGHCLLDSTRKALLRTIAAYFGECANVMSVQHGGLPVRAMPSQDAPPPDAPWLAEADAVLAKLSERAAPVEIDEEELAKALLGEGETWESVKLFDRQRLRHLARAAIAYFREQCGATTKPAETPPSAAGQTVKTPCWLCNDEGFTSRPCSNCGQSLGTQIADATRKKAEELRNVGRIAVGEGPIPLNDYDLVNTRAFWLAVARHVEAEVRAAKRNVLAEVRGWLKNVADRNQTLDYIEGQMAALDAEGARE